MDLSPDDTQRRYRDRARAFSDSVLLPGYRDRERAGRIDPDLRREMGRLGLIAPQLPAALGGAGTDGLTTGLVLEEIGRGESVAFLKEVDAINLRRRQRVIDLVKEVLGGSAYRRRVAVLGLAFKPDSDDIRDSPALDVAVQLHGLGAEVVAWDPQAVPNARAAHPQLTFAAGVEEALAGAEAVVLATEWPQFRGLDPSTTAEHVASPVIIDGRNVLDPDAWRAAGWTYRGLGRP